MLVRPPGNTRWKTVRLFVPKLITPLPILPLPFCFSFLLNCGYILEFRNKCIFICISSLFLFNSLKGDCYCLRLILVVLKPGNIYGEHQLLGNASARWIVLTNEALHVSTLHDMFEAKYVKAFASYWQKVPKSVILIGIGLNLDFNQ